jgi:hypothetical protein
MAHRKHPAASAPALSQDEIPTVRPAAQSGWQKHAPVSVNAPRLPPPDGLWQLVCDLMRAEADEALWGMRR